MSIATQISRLQDAKAALKSSIEAKGVTVASDATLDAYPALVDSIPSGGGGTGDVRFLDYDGSIVQSYSAADFANLAEMPTNPTHEGLTAQGWNWSLADAKTYVAAYGKLYIGQMYTPTDGKTKLLIRIISSNESISLNVNQSVDGGTEIDWGDNSAVESVSGTGKLSVSHQYSVVGDYTISVNVVNGTSSLYGSSNASCMGSNPKLTGVHLADNLSLESYVFRACKISFVTLPLALTSIPSYAFYLCYSLLNVVLPRSCTIGNYCFNYAESLQTISFGQSISGLGAYSLQNCYNLQSVCLPSGATLDSHLMENDYHVRDIVIPEGVASIPDYCFCTCSNVRTLRIPSTVTSIGSSALSSMESLTVLYCLAAAPPSLTRNPWLSFHVTIYVPAASVEAYKTATNWINYTSQIQAIPTA